MRLRILEHGLGGADADGNQVGLRRHAEVFSVRRASIPRGHAGTARSVADRVPHADLRVLAVELIGQLLPGINDADGVAVRPVDGGPHRAAAFSLNVGVAQRVPKIEQPRGRFAIVVAHEIGVAEVDSRVDHGDNHSLPGEPVDAPEDYLVPRVATRIAAGGGLWRKDGGSCGQGGEIDPGDLVAKRRNEVLPQRELAHSRFVINVHKREAAVVPDRISPRLLQDVATFGAGIRTDEFHLEDKKAPLKPRNDHRRRPRGRSVAGQRGRREKPNHDASQGKPKRDAIHAKQPFPNSVDGDQSIQRNGSAYRIQLFSPSRQGVSSGQCPRMKKYTREDSTCDLRFRKPPLYPTAATGAW